MGNLLHWFPWFPWFPRLGTSEEISSGEAARSFLQESTGSHWFPLVPKNTEPRWFPVPPPLKGGGRPGNHSELVPGKKMGTPSGTPHYEKVMKPNQIKNAPGSILRDFAPNGYVGASWVEKFFHMRTSFVLWLSKVGGN